LSEIGQFGGKNNFLAWLFIATAIYFTLLDALVLFVYINMWVGKKIRREDSE
jgi:hypothetical protein